MKNFFPIEQKLFHIRNYKLNIINTKNKSYYSTIIPKIIDQPSLKLLSKNTKLPFVNKKNVIIEEKTPSIFLKKANRFTKAICLNSSADFQGIEKYFAPTNVEWVNSVYSYNNNYNKLLTIADKHLMDLADSYTNLKFRRKQKAKKIARAKKLGLILPLYRSNRRRISLKKRLSLNKVFIANGGIKHTSTKAIITLFFYKKAINYIKYDTISKLFRLNFKKIQREIKPYPAKKILPKLKILAKRKIKSFRDAQLDIIKRNKRKKTQFELRNKVITMSNKELKYGIRKIHRRVYFINLGLIEKFKNSFNWTSLKVKDIMLYAKFLNRKVKLVRLTSKGDQTSPLLQTFKNKMTFYYKKGSDIANARNESRLYRKSLIKYNNHIKYFFLNELKFKKRFIENFQRIISKLYNKNVLFNFVKLNKFLGNSNIYSQMLNKRLKIREKNISTVLTKSLAKIKLAKMAEKPLNEVVKLNILIARTKLRKNILFHLNIFHLFSSKMLKKTNKFWFDSLLFKYDRVVNPFSLFGRITLNHKKTQNLRSAFFPNRTKYFKIKLIKTQFDRIFKRFNLKVKFIKNKVMAGIRIELNGRLTRRFKAARPLYKLKWLGGSRNIDASYSGLPVALVRGHVLSNLESTTLISSRRIGAYAIKTVVSSTDPK